MDVLGFLSATLLPFLMGITLGYLIKIAVKVIAILAGLFFAGLAVGSVKSSPSEVFGSIFNAVKSFWEAISPSLSFLPVSSAFFAGGVLLGLMLPTKS
jgi:uncharacterized membrane protein (Fun14 family)